MVTPVINYWVKRALGQDDGEQDVTFPGLLYKLILRFHSISSYIIERHIIQLKCVNNLLVKILLESWVIPINRSANHD